MMVPMPRSKRALGRSDLAISSVVFGAMDRAGRHDDEGRLRVMHAAIDAGITTVDTAPLYEFGRSEELVGRVARDRRDEMQILTKVGLRWDDAHDGHGDVLFAFRDGERMRQVRRDSRPASIRFEVEASLGRLGVDCIDLVQIHHPDPHTPIAESVGALARLCEEGKLRAIGVSNYSAEQMREAARALGDVPLASQQLRYSLLERQAERQELPAARELGVSILAHGPLAQGALAGRDRRSLAPDDARRWSPPFHPKNARPLRRAMQRVVEPIARSHDATPAQVCLAWLLAQPPVAGVLVGGSSVAQVQEAAGAAELALTPAERAGLRAGFEGMRYDRNAGKPWHRRARERGRRAAARLRHLLGLALPSAAG